MVRMRIVRMESMMRRGRRICEGVSGGVVIAWSVSDLLCITEYTLS